MHNNSSAEVKVTVLGCAGSSYDEEVRLPCSSYLIESADAAILLDCGFGSFESYLNLASESLIDAIFVSHAHADHVADLEAFMDCANVWRNEPRLLASPETMAYIAPKPDSLPEGTLVFVAEGTRFDLPTFEAEFSLTTHKMPTYAACIFMSGRRIVYCADTGPTWVIPTRFIGAELAIVECTLESRSDGSSVFHLDAQEAGMLARELSADRTLITHIPPRESAEARFEIVQRFSPNENFVLAKLGLQLAVR